MSTIEAFDIKLNPHGIVIENIQLLIRSIAWYDKTSDA